MKRIHVKLLVALVLVTASIVVTHHNAEARDSSRIISDVVINSGEEGGGSIAPPYQGEPDVGQTSGDPSQVEPFIGDIRMGRASGEGLMSLTTVFWVARLFGIGI